MSHVIKMPYHLCVAQTKQNKAEKRTNQPTNKQTIAGSLQAKLIFSVINRRIRLMFSYCAAGFIIAASKRLMLSLNYTHV